MSMKRRKTIPWKFSDKQKEYLTRCRDATYNFAEGAVRSGKTVCNILAFARALEESPDKLHLATGVTIAAAKLNLGDCNGFGLEHLFRGRCRWQRYHDNPALYVETKTGPKRIIFAGGGKSDSYKRIRGNSYGLWLATEVNKHHIADDDTCFLQEAFNRQLAAKRRQVFWDFNPDYPKHPVYVKYVDKFRREGLNVNYMHFTIFDNPTVGKKQLESILRQYQEGSVWYRRWILGERCAAEGLIFPAFTEHPERWTVSAPPRDIAFLSVGCDYGGTASRTVFTAVGIREDFRGVCVVDCKRLPQGKGKITPDELEREFISFLFGLEKKFHLRPRYAFMDSEGQYLTNGIRSACAAAGLAVAVCDCKKVTISDRIACKMRLMNEGRWSVMEGCKAVIDSTAELVWDTNAPDRRLDNGTTDVDTADAEEYAWSAWIKQFSAPPKEKR